MDNSVFIGETIDDNTDENSAFGVSLLTPSKDEDESFSLLSHFHRKDPHNNNNNTNHHQIQQQQRQHHTSNHLLQLQKEIKEEEDEIFADINSLINRGSHLYSTLVDDDDDEEDEDDDKPYFSQRSHTSHHHNQYNNNNNNTDREQDEEDEEADEERENNYSDEQNNYSDEQTFASCSQVDQQDYQKLQAVIQQVTSNLPKPCVFFLEGNCRRIDCKYSHDLSNITCKYWIEGFCFKGELCPFQHNYPTNDSEDPNLLDEDGISALSKKKFYPTFVIESEADFPSLPLDAPITALNDSSKSSNDTDTITTTIKNQILNSNPAVVFKTVKKKRKRG